MSEQEVFQLAVKNLMDLFITPEVRSRQEEGKLPVPLKLTAWQIVFYPDGRAPQVRINEEIRILLKSKLKEGLEKSKGDPVFLDDIDGIEGLTLGPDDDKDAAHASFVQLGEIWYFGFDFVYNKDLALTHINAARQFLSSAQYNLANENWSPFVDNLFSAAELCAKAILLCLYSDPRFRATGSHGAIHSRFNRFAQWGNVPPEHVDAFNKLAQLRKPARYMTRILDISDAESKELLANVESLLEGAYSVANIQ